MSEEQRSCKNRECGNPAGQVDKPKSPYCSRKCQAREQNIRQGRIKGHGKRPALIPLIERQKQNVTTEDLAKMLPYHTYEIIPYSEGVHDHLSLCFLKGKPVLVQLPVHQDLIESAKHLPKEAFLFSPSPSFTSSVTASAPLSGSATTDLLDLPSPQQQPLLSVSDESHLSHLHQQQLPQLSRTLTTPHSLQQTQPQTTASTPDQQPTLRPQNQQPPKTSIFRLPPTGDITSGVTPLLPSLRPNLGNDMSDQQSMDATSTASSLDAQLPSLTYSFSSTQLSPTPNSNLPPLTEPSSLWPRTTASEPVSRPGGGVPSSSSSPNPHSKSTPSYNVPPLSSIQTAPFFMRNKNTTSSPFPSQQQPFQPQQQQQPQQQPQQQQQPQPQLQQQQQPQQPQQHHHHHQQPQQQLQPQAGAPGGVPGGLYVHTFRYHDGNPFASSLRPQQHQQHQQQQHPQQQQQQQQQDANNQHNSVHRSTSINILFDQERRPPPLKRTKTDVR